MSENCALKIYSLHKKTFTTPKIFKVILENETPQLIKHSTKNIYACLFHTEVRNKVLIENFLDLK